MNSVIYGEGYRGHCKELKSGPLRSNLVRSARAAYVTFYKLESEYPLTVLATPPLQNDSATTKPPFATTKPLPSSLSPLPSHYQAPFLRIRKAFCSRLAERPKKRLCSFAAHQTNSYSPKVQRHLVSRCPGQRRQSPQQIGTLKTMFSRFKHDE